VIGSRALFIPRGGIEIPALSCMITFTEGESARAVAFSVKRIRTPSEDSTTVTSAIAPESVYVPAVAVKP